LGATSPGYKYSKKNIKTNIMMQIKLFTILSILSLFSLKVQSQSLEENRKLKKYFNASEIQELKDFILSFKNELLPNKGENVAESYKYFFVNFSEFLKNMERTDTIIDASILKSQAFFINDYKQKHSIITSSIDTNLYKEIWKDGVGYIYKYNSVLHNQEITDTIYLKQLNFSGKYVGFIKSYAENEKSLTDYWNTFFKYGDFSCDYSLATIAYFQNLDYTNETIELISVVQIISWLDEIFYSNYN
jgi:hypothetical protein